MIYRPSPVSEAKLQAIEQRIKAKIIASRHSSTTPHDYTLADPAFLPACGRYEAIVRRIQVLRRQRDLLRKRLNLDDGKTEKINIENVKVIIDQKVNLADIPQSLPDDIV